jgi:hypothetical protein
LSPRGSRQTKGMSGSDLTRPPRRIGSRSLGEFPLDVVRIDCERCGRAGRYALAGLVERFGADAAGPDVLNELAACERRRDFSRPCGARFTDLVARR